MTKALERLGISGALYAYVKCSMPGGGGEERTAGSDQKIRYSSGAPISLDPRYIYFFRHTHRNEIAAHMVGVGRGKGRGMGGRGGWEMVQVLHNDRV